jgi:hypothetical protein
MKLVVLNSPRLAASDVLPYQTVVVTYDPNKQVTTIDCDIDIVTLGLAVNVLQEQYEKFLKQLDPKIAKDIEETTRKAVRK